MEPSIEDTGGRIASYRKDVAGPGLFPSFPFIFLSSILTFFPERNGGSQVLQRTYVYGLVHAIMEAEQPCETLWNPMKV